MKIKTNQIQSSSITINQASNVLLITCQDTSGNETRYVASNEGNINTFIERQIQDWGLLMSDHVELYQDHRINYTPNESFWVVDRFVLPPEQVALKRIQTKNDSKFGLLEYPRIFLEYLLMKGDVYG